MLRIFLIIYKFQGGNAALVLTQRLIQANSTFIPKLNILIYPWLQMFSLYSPSMLYYSDKGVTSILSFGKVMLWYLGYKNENLTQEMEDAINSNHHTLLLNEVDRKKYQARIDLSLVPENYKKNSYYSDEKILNLINGFPKKLNESSIFVRNKELANKVQMFFTDEMSPGNNNTQN